MFTSHPLRQDWTQPLPKYWCDNSPFKTHFLNAQSIAFPSAERFFISIVKQYRDSVTDPVLKAEVAEFVKQEIWHTYAHEQYNKWLDSQGVAATRLANTSDRRFEWIKKTFSPRSQLAITVACEHITALTGAHSLQHRSFLKSMDPHFENIWRWHSIEEVEHKSVTMDVYQSINGKTISRQLALIFAIMFYVWSIGKTTVQLLHADKQLWKLQTAKDAWQLLFAPKGVIRETWIKVLHFLRRDFHPNDHDDTRVLRLRKT